MASGWHGEIALVTEPFDIALICRQDIIMNLVIGIASTIKRAMLSFNRVSPKKSNDSDRPMRQPQTLSIAVDEKRKVSGLLQLPSAARACYVLAHGAGAGMAHPFMAAVADGLAERNVATLRYQFPYME